MSPLIACWHDPGTVPRDATILSFLGSTDEDSLRRRLPGRVVSARDASRNVRVETRRLYLDLVADVGVALRHRVGVVEGASRWWFHPVSFRDCESDPAYDHLVAIQTIRGQSDGLTTLVGAPAEVAAVLGVAARETQPEPSRPMVLARALASRARMAIRELGHIRASRMMAHNERNERIDVALSGFWDWSVAVDEATGRLADRYFRGLREALEVRGSRSAVFAWLDPDTEPGKTHRLLTDVVAPLRGRTDVVVLQNELRAADVLAAYSDFRPLLAYRAARAKRSFQNLFVREGIDYFPLFDVQLMRGFAGAALPNCELVLTATKRALKRHSPRMIVSFLENFPHARAQYAAARETDTATCVTQHASYSHEKTFLVLDPAREFRGEPDGLACPHADLVCAAGELGRTLFLESGYESAAVTATGSPRYDHLRVISPTPRVASSRRRLLIVGGIVADVELDMIEAVAAATRGRDDVEVIVRNHPFRRLDEDSRFTPLRDRVAVSTATLDQDLASADVVVFSYSTVAEEAFLRGKPVWQWLPPGFNGSALAEVWRIPQFSTVDEFREALDAPIEMPSPEAQRQVALALFGPCDGEATNRVCAAILCNVDAIETPAVSAGVRS